MTIIPRSEYLTADDIGKGLEVTFTSEGKTVPKETTGFNQDTYEIWVTGPPQPPDGEMDSYKWSINKTSRETVAEKFGRDDKNWIGKTVKLGIVKVSVAGKIRNAIMVMGIK